jgi:hypothetical protein
MVTNISLTRCSSPLTFLPLDKSCAVSHSFLDRHGGSVCLQEEMETLPVAATSNTIMPQGHKQPRNSGMRRRPFHKQTARCCEVLVVYLSKDFRSTVGFPLYVQGDRVNRFLASHITKQCRYRTENYNRRSSRSPSYFDRPGMPVFSEANRDNI